MNGLRMDELSAEVEVLESYGPTPSTPPDSLQHGKLTAAPQQAYQDLRPHRKDRNITTEAVKQCADRRDCREANLQQDRLVDNAVRK